MMSTLIRRILAFVVVALLGWAGAAQAQYSSDIDIYGSPTASGEVPNILFVVDNTANWNSAFTNEMAALVSTINALPINRFRVGIMMFTEPGGSNSGEDGGYIRSAVRLLNEDYKTKLVALLTGMTSSADKTSGGKAGLAMAEAFSYFNGGAPYSGNNKEKTDFIGNTSGTTASNAIYGLSGNALASKAGTKYVSPIINGCQRNYIIYISNGAVQDNASDTTKANTLLNTSYAVAGLVRPPDITLNPNGSQSGVSDEWARFMRASSRNIATYTLDVDKVTNGQGPGWSAMLNSMASNSGGQYYAVSSGGTGSEIGSALNDIFNQIQAVDSIFSSASLPVSVNARGTYLNQIFMGVFRPDGNANPRWVGNVKQYKFSYNPTTDQLFLSDKNDLGAVSGATGFISPSATSYWSTTSTFWINKQAGTPASASDAPDGAIVEKGGAAQRLREVYSTDQSTRNVYTCIACAANTNLATSTATQFISTNSAITSASLAVPTASRVDLINWARGSDNLLNESGPGGTVTVRPSIHGDVLHSRPSVVNYGTATGVVVFYGSNDGTLRAISGKQSGSGAGNELWSFIPEEHLSKLNRLRTNTPDIRLSTTVVGTPTSSTTPKPRDYFVDGAISVYQKILANGSNEKVYLYAAMRRGGRLLYAFDVTDPASPKFLWKKTNEDISVLGQTWSEPKVAKIRGNANPVIIMGAGYDAAAEDIEPPALTTTMGNAVLVLDAFTGNVLKKFPTIRSVAADVALIDSDFDGYVDRVYATDVGGNVYRIDLEKTIGGITTFADAAWGIYTVASLGVGTTRKFFYPPDVVLTPGFTALLMGTGDREKPLATTSADSFFTIKDMRLVKGTPLIDPTVVIKALLGRVGSAENTDIGCYIDMSTSGEKIVNAPLSVGGITYFSTNQPTSALAEACTANLGLSKVYSAPLFCKAATSQTLIGGGLPPSPVTGTVLLSYTPPGSSTPTSKYVPFIIGAPNSKGSGIEGSKITPLITPVRTRRYWNLENAR